MRRLFRRFFEWLGWLKPVIAETTETVCTETEPTQEEESVTQEPTDVWAEAEPTEAEEAQDLVEYYEANIQDKPQVDTPTKPKLPKDANDVQNLDGKYNNSRTVYRDAKGRYASID